MAFRLKCAAFKDQEMIPVRYAGEGSDVSPPLRWSGVPVGTEEFALICEDPDAPGDEPFIHWVIYNISPNTTFLPEGVPGQPTIEVPIFATQGTNSFGNFGYGGPMPPIGHGLHHYIFRLYALNQKLGLPPGISETELRKAIEGKILDAAQLVGKYIREKVAEEQNVQESA